MPHFIRTLVLSMFLILGLVSSVFAGADGSALERIQKSGQLVLGTSGNMPSMTQLDAEGNLSGFDIDMAKFMAGAMGVDLVTKVMPFAELLPAIKDGKVDVVISNMTITPMRNLEVAFVGPYMTSGKCIVTKNEVLAQDEASDSMNIPETSLAVLKGSTSEDVARQLYAHAKVVTVDNLTAAADMVKNDEVSGMLSDYPICMATLQANPDAGFVTLFSLLTYEPIGIALPANDAQFINWTQNFLHRLEGTDTLTGLGERWLGQVTLEQ